MKTQKNPLSAGKEIKLSFSLAAIIYLTLGILMLLAPNTSRKLLCTLVGVGMLIYGLLHIVPSLMSKGEKSYTLDLLIGVSALAFGVFSLFNPTFLLNFLFTVMGVIIAVTSVSGLKRALNLRSFGFMRWWAPMLSSCATLLLALSVIFLPGFYGNMLMMAIGVLLIVEGVSDLLSIHFLSGYAKRVKVTYTVDEK